MNLSQQQIAYILSLIEHKNFGKAAEACFVTQPTLSMQVKKAEETLGHILFNRNRNPLELTAFGQKIAPILYDLQAEYARIELLTKSANGQIKEEIRIGVIPTVAAYLIPELFCQRELFSSQNKWAFVEMKSEEVLEQLASKKIDMGIMAGPVNRDDLHSEPLFNEEMLVYSTEWKAGKKIHMEDLKEKQPWLLSKGNCLRTQMLHFCQLQEESEARWNYEGGNISLLVDMVNQYGGYTLVPEFYSKQYALPQKYLHHISAEHTSSVPARSIIALSSHKQKQHPDLKALWTFLKKNYANTKLKQFEVLSWK